MALGGDIEALDYNTIREKISEVLGTGAGTYGYGQSLQSSAVFSGDTITKAQWNNLRFDILNTLIHQRGTGSLVEIADSQLIDDTAADPVINFNTQTDLARLNRFNIDTTRRTVSAIGSGNATPTPVEGEYVYSSPWSSLLEIELTCTFNNSNEARYFFNSGGKIQVTPSIEGFTSTQQTESWSTLFSQVGTQSFGADTDPAVNYYSLTDQYQTYYLATASASYANNSVQLKAKTNVADNSTGTATILYIKVSLVDGYVDPDVSSPTNNPPDDVVDGTTKLTFTELKDDGSLQPSGSFSITSPFYSFGSFSAS